MWTYQQYQFVINTRELYVNKAIITLNKKIVKVEKDLHYFK